MSGGQVVKPTADPVRNRSPHLLMHYEMRKSSNDYDWDLTTFVTLE
jgi:hypothetical protein